MTRTRSEYRLEPIQVAPASHSAVTIHPTDEHRHALAELMLDGYRGTIDDEGESLDEAHGAIDHYLATMVRSHSFAAVDGADLVAISFVVVVNGLHYIDPVVVASEHKGLGMGRNMVRLSLSSLAEAGCREAGATITDGNVASERLFTGLGFHRIGAWS